MSIYPYCLFFYFSLKTWAPLCYSLHDNIWQLTTSYDNVLNIPSTEYKPLWISYQQRSMVLISPHGNPVFCSCWFIQKALHYHEREHSIVQKTLQVSCVKTYINVSAVSTSLAILIWLLILYTITLIFLSRRDLSSLCHT